METVIIGIAGGTASGKTTVAKKVFHATSKYGTVAMIKIDDYYKILDHLKGRYHQLFRNNNYPTWA